MSEKVLALNQQAEAICGVLGKIGITHLETRGYMCNSDWVRSVTATGNCGDGQVSVTAVREGRNYTYMMQGPAVADGDPGPTTSGELMRGVYRDVGHELLWFLAERPGAGAVDLPLPAGAAETALAA